MLKAFFEQFSVTYLTSNHAAFTNSLYLVVDFSKVTITYLQITYIHNVTNSINFI